MSDPTPFDERAEEAMIGCIACRCDVLDDFQLTPEHFFHFGHRLIFEAASQTHQAGNPVNLHTLSVALSDSLPKIGGMEGLRKALQSVVPASAPTIFDRLEALRTLRRAQTVVHWANGALRDAVQCNEPSEFAAEFSRQASEIMDTAGAEQSILGRVVGDIHAKLKRLDEGQAYIGFRTSLDPWNTAFGGIADGQFYAIAGRPGRGKTAMAEQLAADYMSADLPVVFFEKDMAPQKLVERIACRYARVPFWKLMRNILSGEEREKLRKMTREISKDDRLRLYSPAGMTADQMCSIMRREGRRGAKCGILDHIQTLNVGRDLREGLTQASLTIRRHVTETAIPFIALAHLNREAGGKDDNDRPSPKNIKEFDQLYGDVDGLVLLWHKADQSEKAVKEIQFTVAKNRDFNETEKTLIFNGEFMEFKGEKA
jgi:replicative DNA helicase